VSRNDLYYILACITLISAMLFLRGLGVERKVSLLKPLESLSQVVDGFVGKNLLLSDGSADNLTADAKISRVYVKQGEVMRPIYVSVGYWENQGEQKRIRPPRYTSQEWQYYWIRTKDLDQGGRTPLLLREFLKERGEQKVLIYYCYIINRKIIADEYRLKGLNLLNSLLYRRNNAALVTVSLPVTTEFPLRIAEEYAESFLRSFLPLLEGYLPQ
jgi:EpsI family protein